jgi:uncharacterized membrane protein
MTWYFYLNYRIYKFYEQKRESVPGFFSFSAITVLVSLNVFSIIGILGFIYNGLYDFIISFNKYSVVILFILIGLLNYLVLYRGNHYKEVFLDIDSMSEKYEHWNKSVIIYVVSSTGLLLIVLAIADYLFDGHF